MLTAREIKSLAERVAKAEALVASGAVFPVSGMADYYGVRNVDGTQMYLVHVKDDEVCCSCPDYQNRLKAAGQACKHGHSVMLFREQLPAAEPMITGKRGKAAKVADAPVTDAKPSDVAFYTAELERVTVVAKATAGRVERGEAVGDDYTEAVDEIRKVRKHLEEALAAAGAVQPAIAA